MEGSQHGAPADDRILRFRFNFAPQHKQKKTAMWNRLAPRIVDEDPAAPARAKQQR